MLIAIDTLIVGTVDCFSMSNYEWFDSVNLSYLISVGKISIY